MFYIALFKNILFPNDGFQCSYHWVLTSDLLTEFGDKALLVRQRRCQLPLDLSQHKCFYPTIGDNLGTTLQEGGEGDGGTASFL